MTDDDFAIKLGNRIRELRKIKGVSQLELAYDMDMSMNTISGIELGKISPKIETLRKIAEKLNVSMSELFEFSKILPQDKITRKKIEEIANKLKPHDKEFLELVDKAIDILLKITVGRCSFLTVIFALPLFIIRLFLSLSDLIGQSPPPAITRLILLLSLSSIIFLLSLSGILFLCHYPAWPDNPHRKASFSPSSVISPPGAAVRGISNSDCPIKSGNDTKGIKPDKDNKGSKSDNNAKESQ